MLRPVALSLLALLLGSCQPPHIVVHAAFVGGSLAFVAADRGHADSRFCWTEAAIVDDSLRPAWRFAGSGLGECGPLLPLFYGRPPAGTETLAQPRPIEPGRLYLIVGDATAPVSGAFVLSRAGTGRIVHNVDPESPAAAALRKRWRRHKAEAAAGR